MTMIRTLAITVLCGLAASAGAALAAPDPTALGGSIDKAVPKKANDRDPALVVKAEIPARPDACLAWRDRRPGRRQFSQRRSRVSAAQWPACLRRSGRDHMGRAEAGRRAGPQGLYDYAPGRRGPVYSRDPLKPRGDGSAPRSLLHQRAVGTRREVPHEPNFVARAQSARGFRAGGNGTYRRQRARDAVAVRPVFRRSGSAAQSAKGEQRICRK
jgi:hypothetical protein